METCDWIAQRLDDPGWAICPGFLDPVSLKALADEAWALWNEGEFRRACVGIGPTRQLKPEIRSDRVLWLDDNNSNPGIRAYQDRIEQLRLVINQKLYLGLFSFEAHLAVYPAGACYQRHLDQFRGTRHRIVSCVLYLNQGWQASDGGQLRLYIPGSDEYVDVPPESGTLAVFLSNLIEHEVLPATRERFSLTGWLRLRENTSETTRYVKS